MNVIPSSTAKRPLSLVQFKVAASRIVLPDTTVELACVDGHIDVIGPMSVARPGRYAIGSNVVLLSLDPITASSWLGMPLTQLTDRIVGLCEINPRIDVELAHVFADQRTSDMFKAASLARSADDTRAAHAILCLTSGDSVSQAASAVNLGERQFTRWFRQRTGMHPKRYQRVTRLRRALLAAKQGHALAAVAADAGYADQAHFNREVNALTGAAPRTILPYVGNVQDLAGPVG